MLTAILLSGALLCGRGGGGGNGGELTTTPPQPAATPPLRLQPAMAPRTARSLWRWPPRPPKPPSTTPWTVQPHHFVAAVPGADSGGLQPDSQCHRRGSRRHNSSVATKIFTPAIASGTLVWSDEFSNSISANASPTRPRGLRRRNQLLRQQRAGNYCAWRRRLVPAILPAQCLCRTDGYLHIVAEQPTLARRPTPRRA